MWTSMVACLLFQQVHMPYIKLCLLERNLICSIWVTFTTIKWRNVHNKYNIMSIYVLNIIHFLYKSQYKMHKLSSRFMLAIDFDNASLCMCTVCVRSHVWVSLTSRTFLVGALEFEDVHPLPSPWCHCDSQRPKLWGIGRTGDIYH